MRVVSCNSFGPVAHLTVEERPAVRYVEKVVAGLVDASTQPAAAAPPVQTMPGAPPAKK